MVQCEVHEGPIQGRILDFEEHMLCLICRKNATGPSTDPWGTPQFTWTESCCDNMLALFLAS